ncbi:asparagine synthetase domain-containing protein 1-like [Diadema setosum]|uniref:asparagine synthetase domain-containing protein 1-like n=1 Tax=Diadema setosum TaxID=31175 RepID=UPI003B3B34B6
MCGIFCIVSSSTVPVTRLDQKLLATLQNRGPDLASVIENKALVSRRCSSQLGKTALSSEDGGTDTKQCKCVPQRPNVDKENQCLPSSKAEGELCPDLSRLPEDQTLAGPQPQADGCPTVYGTFIGQVLHLRGEPTAQPVSDDAGNILLWNGEIFGGIEVHGTNDTKVLLDILRDSLSEEDVLKVLEKIRGPWSFIYWQESTSRLWFGRDFFGRRSLLFQLTQTGNWVTSLSLSSVARKTRPSVPQVEEWREVPACGIYSVDLAAFSLSHSLDVRWYPWQRKTSLPSSIPERVSSPSPPSGDVCSQVWTMSSRDDNPCPQFSELCRCSVGWCALCSPVAPLNTGIPDPDAMSAMREGRGAVGGEGDGTSLQATHDVAEAARQLLEVLEDAVRVRVMGVPRRTSFCPDLSRTERTLRKEYSAKRAMCSVSDVNAQLPTLPGGCGGRLCNIDGKQIGSRGEEYAGIQSRSGGADSECVIYGCGGDEKHSCADPESGTACSGEHDDGRCHGDGLCGISASMSEAQGTPSPLHPHALHSEEINCATQEEGQSVCGEKGQPVCCPPCPVPEAQSRVGILFSGGLDSIVLAALADRFVPVDHPIDLFNVAFEQRKNVAPRKKGKGQQCASGQAKRECSSSSSSSSTSTSTSTTSSSSFDVPDRETGRAGLLELQLLNPQRRWNFVEVNVTLEELQEARSQRLCHLVYPQQTVLDDSIGCAIWFAARGRGRLVVAAGGKTEQAPPGIIYDSPAKVVLVGMGADEQLAGYSRHRSKFNAEGWPGLLEEIQMEVDRISARNLGRDDRVISDHGRESRYPYLDENVVSYLNGLPIWLKADLSLPRGVGEKLLLRVAAQQLGLGASSRLPKRAIQFGSRIAKLENNKEKASDACTRLDHQAAN